MNKNEKVAANKDTIFDISGKITNFPITRKWIISITAAVAVYCFFAYAIDLSAYGELASKGLAIFLSCLVLMIWSGMDIFVCALIMVFAGMFTGIWAWGDVSTALGKSTFYSMLGMMIVAAGAEFTPIGRRIAYLFLKWLGQKPVSLCVAVGFATAFMSAFVSNVATLILMSGICNTILMTMGEKPGESRIGRTMMSLIIMGSMLGGCALVSGSPVGNNLVIGFIESGSDGAFSVSYGQWAFFGVISFLIAIIPVCLVYIRFNKVSNSSYNLPNREYYEEKLRELGPMTAPEFRWLIILSVMIALMIAGQSTAAMAMLFAGIALLPAVGVVPANKYHTKIPLSILLAICIVPMMANLLTNTGLIDLISDFLMPILGSLKTPLSFSLVVCLIMGWGVNLTVNAKTGFQAAFMAVIVPISIKLGFNPTVVLMPAMLCSSFFWAMGMNVTVMLNKGYGFWEDKHLVAPGYVTVTLCCVVMSLVCVGLCGLIGLSPVI